MTRRSRLYTRPLSSHPARGLSSDTGAEDSWGNLFPAMLLRSPQVVRCLGPEGTRDGPCQTMPGGFYSSWRIPTLVLNLKWSPVSPQCWAKMETTPRLASHGWKDSHLSHRTHRCFLYSGATAARLCRLLVGKTGKQEWAATEEALLEMWSQEAFQRRARSSLCGDRRWELRCARLSPRESGEGMGVSGRCQFG